MNPITSNVITAIATAVVLGIGGYFMGAFEAGAAAIDEDQIEAVLKRVMVTDSGVSYAANIASINGTMIEMNTRLGFIQDDVANLKIAVRELASE